MHLEAGIPTEGVEEFPHHVLHAAGRQPRTAYREKHRRLTAPTFPAARQPLLAHRQVSPQRSDCKASQGKQSFLATLAAHLHLLAHDVDVRKVDAGQLAKAHPGAVEKLQYGEIPHAGEVVLRRPSLRQKEYLLDLPAIEHGRQPLLRFRQPYARNGIAGHVKPLVEEPVKRPQRRYRTRNRSFRETAAPQLSHEASYGQPIDCLPCPLGSAAEILVAKRLKYVEVTLIRLDSVRRVVPLVSEIRQKALTLGAPHRARVRLPVAHAGTRLNRATNPDIASREREASASRFFLLSRTRCGNGGNRPKLAFMG